MAAQDETLTSEMVLEAAQANWLFERFPDWVVDTLTPEQKDSIHQVIEDPSWKGPPAQWRRSGGTRPDTIPTRGI